MRAVVVYESMYGNTHLVAQAIGDGLGESAQVAVVPVAEASATLADGADLLVVGGPTHVHGLSGPRTRTAAADAAKKPESGLTVEPEAEGPGVRELLESLGNLDMRAAAFDTRIDARPRSRDALRRRSHGSSASIDAPWSLIPKASWSPRTPTSSPTRRLAPGNGAPSSRLGSRPRAPSREGS